MEIKKDHIEHMIEEAHTLEEVIKLKVDDLYRLGYAVGYAQGYDYGKKESNNGSNEHTCVNCKYFMAENHCNTELAIFRNWCADLKLIVEPDFYCKNWEAK